MTDWAELSGILGNLTADGLGIPLGLGAPSGARARQAPVEITVSQGLGAHPAVRPRQPSAADANVVLGLAAPPSPSRRRPSENTTLGLAVPPSPCRPHLSESSTRTSLVPPPMQRKASAVDTALALTMLAPTQVAELGPALLIPDSIAPLGASQMTSSDLDMSAAASASGTGRSKGPVFVSPRSPEQAQSMSLSYDILRQLPQDDEADSGIELSQLAQDALSQWLQTVGQTLYDIDDIVTMVAERNPQAQQICEKHGQEMSERIARFSEAPGAEQLIGTVSRAAKHLSDIPSGSKLSHSELHSQSHGRPNLSATSDDESRHGDSNSESTSRGRSQQHSHHRMESASVVCHPEPLSSDWVISDVQLLAALGSVGVGSRVRATPWCTSATQRGDMAVDGGCGALDVLDGAGQDAPWELAHGLWLCNAAGARCGARLAERGITHVVRLSEEDDQVQIRSLKEHGVRLVSVKTPDSSENPILQRHLIEARHTWAAALQVRGGLVVHCHAGLNRSVAICCGLLMTGLGWKLLPTISHVATQRRNHVLINTSFRRQLVDLAAALNLLLPLQP
eukprot:TRINITY_DN20838_c0_g1_i1.p1 TRINITY_DN20838_c0_g1~~TRINITY_DN20838_c0_g1_i1.p1  ORF type:complete len:597 (+),score=95.31 TRINITY_DN20838_c0_g1_i1:94-1791(+)